MKIVVDAGDGQRIKIHVPLWLMMNDIVAAIAPPILKQNGMEMSKQQIKQFAKEVRRCKKVYGNWKMLEVQSSSGEHVEITM